MSLDLISFVLGGGLLLIGLIGGGIEAKEIKIPSIGTNIRIGAGIFGISFIVLGIWLAGRFNEPEPRVKTEHVAQFSTPANASGEVFFVVRDQLGENQRKENIVLYINGAPVGEVNISGGNPAASFSVKLPAEGDYEYALSGFVDVVENEAVKRFSVVGQGTLPVTQGSIFVFKVKDSSGNAITLALAPP